MSIPVDLESLRDELAARQRPAYLVTAGDEGGPHLVATYLTWSDGAFTTGCGSTTARNLTQRPQASVVVPPDEPHGYSLIFDAAAEVVEGEERTVRLAPRKAVLHRPAVDGGVAGGHAHDCAPLGG